MVRGGEDDNQYEIRPTPLMKKLESRSKLKWWLICCFEINVHCPTALL